MEYSFITILVWVVFNVVCYENDYDYACPQICSCPSINKTNCQNNELNQLPEGINADVTHLDVSFNNFKALPNFSQYRHVRWLNMSYNKLEILLNDTLSGLDELQLLDLSNNQFADWADIHFDAFQPTKNLLYLDLSQNSLRGFPDFTVPLKIKTLRVLKLENCSITDISGDILDGLPNLEELYLAKNNLSLIRSQIKSVTLKILDMTECQLKHANSEALALLPNLKILKLPKNYELKKFTSYSNSLEYLDLSDCNIESVSSALMPSLIVAIYRGNHIRTLLPNSFNVSSKIQLLDLSNNALSKISEKSFNGLKLLHNVDLSFNTIASLDPYTFRDNFKLVYLNLSHNYFTRVTEFDIESLKYLDFGNCEIRTFNKYSLGGMPNLKELVLARNLLTRLPEETEAFALISLDLSQCHITRINNKTFAAMPRLRKLNLAGNRLTSDMKVSYFPQVIDLRLDDNPWHCDCSFDFLEIYEQFPQKLHELRCQSPENVEGETWVKACMDDWYPSQSRKDSMWWYSLGLIIIIVVMFCIIMSIRRAYQQKEQRLREIEERERAEARERLRRMRERQIEARQEENRNAPDPRELQRPPSYTEALLMSNLDGSYPSLSGSRHSLAANRQTERGSNQDVSKRTKRRRKRRKEKLSSSDETQTSSRRTRRRSEEYEQSSSESEPTRRVALESDF